MSRESLAVLTDTELGKEDHPMGRDPSPPSRSKAARVWTPSVVFYVANLPGDGGVDWGYDTDPKRAIELSPYWLQRFHAMCRKVGAQSWSTP